MSSRSLLSILFFLILISGVLFGASRYYRYIFSSRMVGEIVAIQKIEPPRPGVIPVSDEENHPNGALAVAIKLKNGEIFTAVTVDPQWVVAQVGYCAEVKFYPYPPWNLEKSGTFQDARLIKLMECKKD